MPDESSAPEVAQTPSVAAPDSDKAKEHHGDDPHSQMVESLRSQIDDLLSQVTLLNGKVALPLTAPISNPY